MQTIIKLPQDKEDIITADLSPAIIGQLKSYEKFTSRITNELSSYKHITDFLNECLSKVEVYYLKTFPEFEPYEPDEVHEYICYGEYHRNIPAGHKNLFFRIDQKWESFSFPTVDNMEIDSFIKKQFPLLSGTITTDTIFPSIILDQKWLNDKSELIMDGNSLENLYLFSTDYWSRNYLLDRNGDVFEFYLGKLTKTRFNFVTWVDNELRNFFKHPEKP